MSEPTILVVDDSLTVRKIVQRTLRYAGMNVVTVDNGLSALTAVADIVPDMILLDIQLARMDGYSVCQLVHRHFLYHSIPIILLSGKDGMFDKMRGRLSGATDYITKPFEASDLLQKVKKHLNDVKHHLILNEMESASYTKRIWSLYRYS